MLFSGNKYLIPLQYTHVFTYILRHKDGYVIQPSSRYDIVEDVANEKYQLTVKKVGVDDGGVYTLVAKNEVGETSQQAKLIVHSESLVYYHIM